MEIVIDDFSFAAGIIWGALVMIIMDWLYHLLKKERHYQKHLELLARLTEVEMIPVGDMDELYCAWCSHSEYDDEHEEDCPWRQAKELLNRIATEEGGSL